MGCLHIRGAPTFFTALTYCRAQSGVRRATPWARFSSPSASSRSSHAFSIPSRACYPYGSSDDGTLVGPSAAVRLAVDLIRVEGPD